MRIVNSAFAPFVFPLPLLRPRAITACTVQLADLQTSSALVLQVNLPSQPTLGEVKRRIVRTAGSIQASIVKLRGQQIAGGFKVRELLTWKVERGCMHSSLEPVLTSAAGAVANTSK